MRLPILALLVPVALAGCATVAATTPPVSTVAQPTKLDAKIAATSVHLAQYCGVTEGLLTIAAPFVTKPAAAKAVAGARAAVTSYCSGPPPADLGQALVVLASAYNAVMAAM